MSSEKNWDDDDDAGVETIAVTPAPNAVKNLVAAPLPADDDDDDEDDDKCDIGIVFSETGALLRSSGGGGRNPRGSLLMLMTAGKSDVVDVIDDDEEIKDDDDDEDDDDEETKDDDDGFMVKLGTVENFVVKGGVVVVEMDVAECLKLMLTILEEASLSSIIVDDMLEIFCGSS